MVRLRFFLIFLFGLSFSFSAHAQESLQSPEEFLGYELGSEWTPHYKVMNYFKHVANHSSLVSLEQYGTTYEGRELIYATVASDENHDNIEQIRTDNLKRAGLEEGETETNIPIVWLSYNVHGNETSSSEAALKTIYNLVRPDHEESKQWLQNTVVIMDPMLNPDGRDRYVQWYRQTAGAEFNPNPEAREHDEPWPGGRANHYYFDLNRDWVWLTQKESQHRLALYQQWMPQIHVDFHEQSYNSPYYFAPAAEPFHTAITDWQREFQRTIGKNHARYFNENNWLYFTGEDFDLFYPSYGDTYPIFNGAIGMTYEQAGGGSAGLGIITAEGDTLTLTDRLTHHYTTGMSTVEITSEHADEVINEFADYYRENTENPSGEYASYVIKDDNNEDNIIALLELLEKHNIEFGEVTASRSTNGYDFQSGENRQVQIEEGDYVISSRQSKGTLARVLFEPDPELVDSLTYDITSWQQHYAYGLDGFALTDPVESSVIDVPEKEIDNDISGQPYAYIAEWKDPADVQLLADLLGNDIKVRFTEKSFELDGREYEQGTLIITRNGNEAMDDKFDETVQKIATDHKQQLYPAETGFVDSGPDFGSSSVKHLAAPEVALLSGEGTSSTEMGAIWHYFDQVIDYPVTLLNLEDFNTSTLQDYDVFILPPGYYSGDFSDQQFKELQEWIAGGGRLIAVGNANQMLESKEGFAIRQKRMDEATGSAEEASEASEEEKLERYEDRQRENAKNANPGSVYALTMDTSHPLAFGFDDTYFSLKRSADSYAYLDDGWNVGVAKENALVSGFTGIEAQEKLEQTLTFGVQNSGSGAVIYIVDNPLFRGFWHTGKLLFGNAIFIVGR